MMQTDVKQSHLNQSGFLYLGRTRMKGISLRGNTSLASQIDIFDSTTAATAATYAQTGYVVTVTSTGHGLNTGDRVGIAFTVGTGGGATNGNYTITKLTADTFTVTTINSLSITAGAVCRYVSGTNVSWLMSLDLVSGDTYSNYQLFPGEGILVTQGIYAYLSNIPAVSIYYG
jgi:hypothetical protein